MREKDRQRLKETNKAYWFMWQTTGLQLMFVRLRVFFFFWNAEYDLWSLHPPPQIISCAPSKWLLLKRSYLKVSSVQPLQQFLFNGNNSLLCWNINNDMTFQTKLSYLLFNAILFIHSPVKQLFLFIITEIFVLFLCIKNHNHNATLLNQPLQLCHHKQFSNSKPHPTLGMQNWGGRKKNVKLKYA